MSEPGDLAAIREAIGEVDHEILALLRRRLDLVERVLGAKLEAASPLRDRDREEQVLQRVREMAVREGIDPREVERLYRVVLELSLAHQEARLAALSPAPLRIAYQGVEGAYSHLAARERYAHRPEGALLTGHETFRAAAESVKTGAADRALLPIENTTAGSINETYDLLSEGGLAITAEVVSAIEHCLLVLPGARLEDLRVVLSHPQGLLQCADFLRTVPWIRPQAELDTAGAARKVREGGDPTIAAIASRSAARIFDLEVLRAGIQTEATNSTRFVELAATPEPCPPGVPSKTSLLLVLAHRPGALGQVLARIGEAGVNLTKLESRPIPATPFRYRFYLDLEGSAAEEPIRSILEDLAPLTEELRVLGTYPRADRPAAS